MSYFGKKKKGECGVGSSSLLLHHKFEMATSRQAIYLVNCCFLDDAHTRRFTDPRRLRDHLQDCHGCEFPEGLKSTRRYNNKRFLYLQYADSDVSVNYACPCCPGHFNDLNELASHFRSMHEVYLPQAHQRQQQPTQDSHSSVPSCDDLHHDHDTISSASSTTQKRQHDETLSTDGIVFSLPDGDHLVVNNVNVSQIFYQLQESIKTKWKHSLEEHIHLALASTSVLLLTRNSFPNDIANFISYDDWNSIVDSLQEKYGIKRHPMPLNFVSSTLAIVDDLLGKKINREQADAKMKLLSSEPNLHKFAKALGQLIMKLPKQPLEENFGEAELCSRFVEPFLSGLFDNPDDDVFLRWTNETTLETKSTYESNGRPDVCITKSFGVKWMTSLGYGEAKPAARDQDNHLICWDLLKVAVFCKEALDAQSMEGMLGMQIIGRTVKFYVLVLPASRLYGLVDLVTIKIPDSLQQLPGFVTEVANVLKVLDVFDRVCVPSSDATITMSRRAPTLTIPKFRGMFTSSKNRKKQCVLKLRHN